MFFFCRSLTWCWPFRYAERPEVSTSAVCVLPSGGGGVCDHAFLTASKRQISSFFLSNVLEAILLLWTPTWIWEIPDTGCPSLHAAPPPTQLLEKMTQQRSVGWLSRLRPASVLHPLLAALPDSLEHVCNCLAACVFSSHPACHSLVFCSILALCLHPASLTLTPRIPHKRYSTVAAFPVSLIRFVLFFTLCCIYTPESSASLPFLKSIFNPCECF